MIKHRGTSITEIPQENIAFHTNVNIRDLYRACSRELYHHTEKENTYGFILTFPMPVPHIYGTWSGIIVSADVRMVRSVNTTVIKPDYVYFQVYLSFNKLFTSMETVTSFAIAQDLASCFVLTQWGPEKIAIILQTDTISKNILFDKNARFFY